MQAKLLIVEDHKMVAEGIATLLNKEGHLSVVEIVNSRKKAIEALNHHAEIDLVLMDLFLGKAEDHQEPEGLQAIREINQEFNRNTAKKLKIIIVSDSLAGRWIFKAYNMGVRGYVPKKDAANILIKAIEEVIQEKRYYTQEVRSAMDEHANLLENIPEEKVYITHTEKEIINWIAKGFSSQDIADLRKCKVGTIETHRTNIFKKLGAANAANMVSIAKDMDLI